MTLQHGTQFIESQRLLLRRLTHEDLPFLTRIHADPEVALYIGLGRPRSAQESRDYLELTLRTYREQQRGQLAVIRKSDGELLGRCGIGDLTVEQSGISSSLPRAWFNPTDVPEGIEVVQEPELGYTFDRNHWGQGFATEAAAGVFAYARNVLRLPRMISVIYPQNIRSQRVARRFGLVREDSVELAGRIAERYVWPTTPR